MTAKSRATLNSDADTNLADNSAGDISAADVRAAVKDLADSNFNPLSDGVLPIGAVIPYAAATAPSGWLLCFGQNVSRTTYSDLFDAISTVFGVGDGSTTFGLPDLRGRGVAGEDDMGGTSANRLTTPLNGDTFGAVGGAEGVALTIANLAAHTHAPLNGADFMARGGTDNRLDTNAGTDWTDETNETTGSTGSGTAHANVQPTIILAYIIYTGVA
jgi:microcystin-dependent protein